MAVGTVTPNPQQLFRRAVLTNVQYWRDLVTDPETSLADLDQGHQRIVIAIRFALNHNKAWPHTVPLISAFSAYMERRGHWDVWQRILTRAIEAARAAGDSQAEIELSILLARLFARQDQLTAIRQYRRTAALTRQAGDSYNQARIYSNLGYLFVESEHWWRAEVLCCIALQVFEQLDDSHGQAHTHNHLGSLYLRQYRWTPAQRHLEQACALWLTIGDDHGLMYGYMNLGLLHAEAEHAEEALYYSKKALKRARLTGEMFETGAIYLNMSYSYRLNGEAIQAEAYARQAEILFRRFPNTRYLAMAWVNLGEALLNQKRAEKARFYLESALNEFQALTYAYGEIWALLALIKYGQSTALLDQTNRWVSAAETRIAQLSQAAQRHYFQRLLAQYRQS